MNKSNLFLSVFIMMLILAGCRSAEVDGVYGGITGNTDLLTSTHEGKEMALLLRPDGTFTDDMRERDWKSNVKGKYVVTGSTLKLVFNNKNLVEEYRINGRGHLLRKGAIFLKMDKSDTVPAGIYDFKGGSGGPATGQLFVGNDVHASYYFDGKEKFSYNRSQSKNPAKVIGDSIAADLEPAGTYTYNSGELTLNFLNRKTEKHSFYALKEPGTDKLAAVIDGRFYFSGELPGDDSKKADELPAKNVPGADATKATPDTGSISSDKLPGVEQVLDSLRARHGGNLIDEIKTLYVEASSEGFDIFSFTDYQRGRVRYELYQDDKLVAVEQLEGRKGWRWMQGKITALEPGRIDEIIFSQHTGILGLKKDQSQGLLNGFIEPASHGYNLSFQVEGKQLLYILDKDLNLLGDAYRIGDIEQASQYSNFKPVNGISVPYTTEVYRDGQKSMLKVDKFLINETLKTKWNKPVISENKDQKD